MFSKIQSSLSAAFFMDVSTPALHNLNKHHYIKNCKKWGENKIFGKKLTSIDDIFCPEKELKINAF